MTNKKAKILQIVVLSTMLGLNTAPVLAMEPAGNVTCEKTSGFHDGDTFACTTSSEVLRVRVAGIDAPEVGQAFWKVSRDYLRDQTMSGSTVECYKVDQYGRQVCRVRNLGKEDVALGLVKNGLAWHTVKYRSEQTQEEQAAYANAENDARISKRGLWIQSDPQEPSICRELKRQHVSCR